MTTNIKRPTAFYSVIEVFSSISMSNARIFDEPWVQDAAARAGVSSQSPAVVRTVAGAVESQLRVLIQQTLSFQRKGKVKEMKGEPFCPVYARNV